MGEPAPRRPPAWAGAASKGLELAAAVAGFILLGRWIGGHYGNARLGILIGAVLGIVGGMYNLVRAGLAEQADSSANRNKPRE
jgi:hypothetical protein